MGLDIAGLVIAALGLAYGAVSGERAAKEQRAGVRRTQQAQANAEANAAAAQAREQDAQRAARRPTTDPAGLLERSRITDVATQLTGKAPAGQIGAKTLLGE